MSIRKILAAAAMLPALCGAGEPVLHAYSTIDALLAGAYDGDATVGGLRAQGDFGLGTFNALDGELVAFEGVYYHVRADGSVRVAGDDERVPLAYVLPFRPTTRFALEPGRALPSIKALESALDERLPNANLFYAVAVQGEFENVSTRAIPAQARPYRPLAEAARQQSVFRRERLRATLVGLRSPAFSKGVSVAGWHWHLLSDDRTFGGHVLEASLVAGEVQAAALHRLALELPATADFAGADQARDRSAELHEIERGTRVPAAASRD
jgi:acetolactate decarboxylase